MARILVVDDEPHIRQVIGELLSLEGHEVATARDGQEALDSVAARVPDLILLDLAMPLMDGWHVLDALYRRGVRRQTRVVIVTGAYHADAIPAARRSGVRYVVSKPFTSLELLSVVEQVLSEAPDDLVEKADRSAGLARLLSRVDEIL